MSVRAAQDARVQHTWQVDVGAVASRAGHLVDCVVAQRTGADYTVLLVWLGSGGHGVPPGICGRG